MPTNLCENTVGRLHPFHLASIITVIFTYYPDADIYWELYITETFLYASARLCTVAPHLATVATRHNLPHTTVRQAQLSTDVALHYAPARPSALAPRLATVSTHLDSIFDTHPCDTRSCLLMSHGRTPLCASSTIRCRTTSGKGLPFTNTPPNWLTPPWPGK